MRGSKTILLVFLALLSLSLSVFSVDAKDPVGTECDKPRVRKSWESYSNDEKATYIEAVSLAMTKGYHIKFIELHVEFASEREAHGSCMFMYWHRMFLLGYENMLRSLGDKYQCVTLPFWDHLTCSARAAAKKCSNIEDCSPIVQAFGGSTVGVMKDLKVYNVTIKRATNGVCVTGAMCGSFCGNNTDGCAKCIVRGPARLKSYPSSAFFTSVYQQLFTYSDWVNFANAVEGGVHNMVHSAMGGALAYLQSPTDPLFFTHHSLIDALQTIYFKCQMGDDTGLTLDEKRKDPRFFANCPRRDKAGLFKGSDAITMKTINFSGKWVHVRNDPQNTLYPFFKDLPSTFAEYVDAKDLGPYSYSYEFSGALSNMYANCKLSNTKTSATFLGQQDQPAISSGSNRRLPTITRGPSEEDLKMRHWTIAMYEAARINGYTEDGARDQMEMVLCVHKDECLGGVSDYSDLFRQNFEVQGHPRCFTLLKLLKEGERLIGLPRWRELSSRLLPCPSKDKDIKEDKDAESVS
ncbi:hypothetical protein Poli38472_013662 [Pythium oligandrum]|uniref:Tyrosinase copper-binding domain-containing protein n=1 Tax=Pythium oligandrum TaxID=41045 RepID=A0A8K1FHN5_PYTOL|nr:hypothetical protein Poli38472_013662 [Pythium oligandrum]|eukprot:TMW61199.1 hypothetical protein Poli38472_013662 [Pythium oligandrum]